MHSYNRKICVGIPSYTKVKMGNLSRLINLAVNNQIKEAIITPLMPGGNKKVTHT